MNIQPYLMFDGCCEAAIEFYRQALDARIDSLLRHRDNPEPTAADTRPPGIEDKVMHASFTIGDTTVMASDGYCEGQGKPSFSGFSLALNVETPESAARCFAALQEGGTVQMPLAKTFWSPCFGVLTDRFGVNWLINVTP